MGPVWCILAFSGSVKDCWCSLSLLRNAQECRGSMHSLCLLPAIFVSSSGKVLIPHHLPVDDTCMQAFTYNIFF